MITKKEFENIATLSRLSTDDGEYNRFCDDLSRMVEFADRIKEATADDTAYPCDAKVEAVLREDKVYPCTDREDILSNAPCSQDGFFLLRKRA